MREARASAPACCLLPLHCLFDLTEPKQKGFKQDRRIFFLAGDSLESPDTVEEREKGMNVP